MEKNEMLKHIKRFRGSSTWICSMLKVDKSTFSHWIHERKTSKRLELGVPPLVALLLKTGGACMFLDGKSVRHTLHGRKRGPK